MIENKKYLNDWKIGLVYFLIYILFLIIFGMIYTIILISTTASSQLPLFFRILLNTGLILVCLILSGQIVRRFFVLKNPEKVVFYATLFYFILNVVFIFRDLLITEINGMPINRNLQVSITQDVLTVAIFYFASLFIMRKNENFF